MRGGQSGRFHFVDVGQVDQTIRVHRVGVIDLLLFLHRHAANLEIDEITDSEGRLARSDRGETEEQKREEKRAHQYSSSSEPEAPLCATVAAAFRERPRRVSLPRG